MLQEILFPLKILLNQKVTVVVCNYYVSNLIILIGEPQL